MFTKNAIFYDRKKFEEKYNLGRPMEEVYFAMNYDGTDVIDLAPQDIFSLPEKYVFVIEVPRKYN